MSFTLTTTRLTANILERLLKSNLTVDGLEHVPEGPTLFVMNHFTRAEAFLVPYVIDKYIGRYPWSLAHHSLFKGVLAEYFRHMGVISTKRPDRDKLIIGDLLTDRHHWLIYPEGSMVKTKKLIKRGKLHLALPHRVGPPHTGAAALALKTELIRRRYLAALERNDVEEVRDIMRRFDLASPEAITPVPLRLVPVTISYYPLRPGQNILKRLVRRFFHELPGRLAEEVEIEGNLLLRSTDINFYFGEPLALDDYLDRFQLIGKLLPFLRDIETPNLLLKRSAWKLTQACMSSVYQNLQINFDHLYCAALRERRGGSISRHDLYQALYLVADDIRLRTGRRLHPRVYPALERLTAGLDAAPATSIETLATDKGVIDLQPDTVQINRLRLNMMHMFHTIRVNNPFMVIANELEPLAHVMRYVTMRANASTDELQRRTLDAIRAQDLALFKADHTASLGRDSKPTRIGAPIYLPAADSRRGIVLSHGLLASPGEMRPMAEYFQSQGYHVYVVRLRGHGTAPEDLERVTWQEWLASYIRGIAALRACCDDIVLGGFSTGGLIALRLAAELGDSIRGVFAISPPATLRHIRAHLAPAVHAWNELLGWFHSPRGAVTFVDNSPEYPDTNYQRVYLGALVQLRDLMRDTAQRLPDLTCPAHLYYARQDPTVHPHSSQKLYELIKGPDRELEMLDFDRHVIVRGKRCEAVWHRVHRFVRDAIGDTTAPHFDLIPEQDQNRGSHHFKQTHRA